MLLVGGCDHRPISIEGGRVPRFRLRGRGNIQMIAISGPDLAKPLGDRALDAQPMKVYWELVPKGDYDLHNLEERGPLIYGQVPEGLKQNYPADGTPPDALFEKGLFTFQLRTADGDAMGVRFHHTEWFPSCSPTSEISWATITCGNSQRKPGLSRVSAVSP
jgi:hypothetical protein